MLNEIIASVRRRIAQGDCPTEKAYSVEMLEDALDTCASERDNARIDTIKILGEATHKFAPDLAKQLIDRWEKAKADLDKATDEFLAVLRSGKYS